MTRSRLKLVVVRFEAALRKCAIPVSAIYLFGSHARGHAHPGSDIDLCVVSKAFGKDDFDEMVKINQIAKRVAPEIEAFPVAEYDWKRMRNPFLKEAVRTGRRIL